MRVGGEVDGLVGRVGTRLVAEVADRIGLTGGLIAALDPGGRQRDHAPGRVMCDVAVGLVDGASCIEDLAALRAEPDLFGPLASSSTIWRTLDDINGAALERLRAARAAALERAVSLAGYAAMPPPVTAAGAPIRATVIDLDVTITCCRSEKEGAAPTWKRTYGFHPLLASLADLDCFLSGMLRSGNAGSNTAADHIDVLFDALAAVPKAWLDHPVRVRGDTAAFTHDFLAQIRALRPDTDTDTDERAGLDIRFSVGCRVDAVVQAAISAVPEEAWSAATRSDGTESQRGQTVEITDLVRAASPAWFKPWPTGMRLIARRERPHSGAKLTLWEAATGWRHQVVATDCPASETVPVPREEAEHRQHACVEDRMRQGKQMGLALLPSRIWDINAAWLELVICADQLTALTRLLGFDDHDPMRRTEIKRLRYRILHVPGRITRTGRQVFLHLPRSWPWIESLRTAWARITAIPIPA
nr:IS1380 family transposase [Glycomyces sp. L485]